MISINKKTEQHVSTIASLSFTTNDGTEMDTLYKAILYNQGYPSEEIIDQFRENLFFKPLTYKEDRYLTFIAWDDNSIEQAILVIAKDFGLVSYWNRASSNGNADLVSFYQNLQRALPTDKKEGVSFYFHSDFRYDYINNVWGLSAGFMEQIEQEIADLNTQHSVLLASLNEAKWDTDSLRRRSEEFKKAIGSGGVKKQEASAADGNDALQNILGTLKTSSTSIEVPPTPLSSNSDSGEEVKKPVEDAKEEEKEEVVDLWHWERDTDAVTAINACNRVCRGFPLQPRVTTVTFKCSDTQEPLMQVMSGIEFVPIDVSISAGMRMYEGMWLARGVDEDVDGSRYDTLQIVTDTKEGRVVYQQYRVKL